jgi:hypothetical protein
VWDAIQYVGTGLSLVAFIVAAILLAYRARLKHRAEIIKSAPEKERVEAIAATAEFFRVDISGLSRAQQQQIVLAQIQARTQRDLLLAGIVLFVALLLAMVALTAILTNRSAVAMEDQNWKRDYAILIQKPKMDATVGPGSPDEFDVIDRSDFINRLNSLSLIGKPKLQADRDDLVLLAEKGPWWNKDNPWSVRYSVEMKNKFKQLRLDVRSVAATRGVDVERVEQLYAPEPRRVLF